MISTSFLNCHTMLSFCLLDFECVAFAEHSACFHTPKTCFFAGVLLFYSQELLFLVCVNYSGLAIAVVRICYDEKYQMSRGAIDLSSLQ